MFRVSFQVMLVALLILLMTGCAQDKMDYDNDSKVVRKMAEFSRKGPQGAKFRLDEATSFVWEDVFFFLEGSANADINKVIGQELFAESDGRMTEPGPLLVFTNGGKLVHAALVLPPVFLHGTNYHRYSRDEAILVAISKDPGPYVLDFAENARELHGGVQLPQWTPE